LTKKAPEVQAVCCRSDDRKLTETVTIDWVDALSSDSALKKSHWRKWFENLPEFF
jgi:hypothetical protein